MTNFIRKTNANDIPSLIELAERKRLEYQAYQPRFWRKAADSAQKQALFFEKLLQDEQTISYVAERAGLIEGFIIGRLVAEPPVYNPGGPTCLVDDFIAADWQNVGIALLETVMQEAKLKGAIQMVVVCARQDEPKAQMLETNGFPTVTEWRVRGL